MYWCRAATQISANNFWKLTHKRGLAKIIRTGYFRALSSDSYSTIRRGTSPSLTKGNSRPFSSIESHQSQESNIAMHYNAEEISKYDVIIVGAGMAGLSAAYRILTQRPSTKLLILESRERVGGRIWSLPFDTKKFGLDSVLEGGRSIDLGASFIHGVLGNPLVPLAKKIGLPVKRTADPSDPSSATRAFTSDGKIIPPEVAAEFSQRVFETVFGWLPALAQGEDGGRTVVKENVSVKDGVLMEGSPIYGYPDVGSHDAHGGLRTAPDEDDKLWLALSLARSFQGWTGAPIDYVSLKWWGFNQDTEGGDGILVRGYGEMVDWLKDEIERLGGVIRLQEKVVSVELVEDETEDAEEEEGGKVVLTTRVASPEQIDQRSPGKRTYEASYTLLTLPLGVLKQSPPKFTPPLTIRRQQAISRLGMGLLDKIVLVYDKAWWASTSPGGMINILIPSKDDPTRLLGPSRGLPPDITSTSSSPQRLKGAFPARTPAYLKENPQSLMVFDLHAQCGIPALSVFIPGEFGDVVELCDDAQTDEWVVGVVGQWLGGLNSGGGDSGEGIPRPVEVIRTAWRKDENAYGSYAYIPVGGYRDGVDRGQVVQDMADDISEEGHDEGHVAASPLDQLELTRTMWGRCFWAGEHTEVNQFASVHAAWTSGVRESEKILIALEGVDL